MSPTYRDFRDVQADPDYEADAAAIVDRLKLEMATRNLTIRDVQRATEAAGTPITYKTLWTLYNAAFTPRSVIDPRFLRTLRTVSTALGKEDAYWLEGGQWPDGADTHLAFGVRLRNARLNRAWTQSDVTRATGINQSRIWMYERGLRPPRSHADALVALFAFTPPQDERERRDPVFWPYGGRPETLPSVVVTP
jgi:hypothetical protein